MKPVKLSIVIVSYNVRYHLEQCLHSVQRALLGIDAEVWVVDNASTDGSVEYLQPRFPEVKFISNAENLGFSRANNLAIRKSSGEYVLLLNPDTIVAEPCVCASISLTLIQRWGPQVCACFIPMDVSLRKAAEDCPLPLPVSARCPVWARFSPTVGSLAVIICVILTRRNPIPLRLSLAHSI